MVAVAANNYGGGTSARICEVGGIGLFLPLGGDSEQLWPNPLRIILYGLGLAWCFMGVALISDVFMGAIECITAKKSRKYNPNNDRWYTAEVWNPTVANLTLMALGSSAPEILLSVIELFGNEFYSGELGPSTIVGSAAFNLLVIIAVCVSAIPDNEFRRIKEMPVFVITATFSVFAYLWLMVILLGRSPNVVEPWEGIVTFLFFPVLVSLAFLADIGYFSKSKPKMGSQVVLSADMSKEELAALDMRIRKEYSPDLTTEQVSKIILIESTEQKQRASRAQYRVAAVRAITAGKRIHLDDPGETAELLAKQFTGEVGEKLRQSYLRRNSWCENGTKVVPEDVETGITQTPTKTATIEFAVQTYAVLENAGVVKLTVVRDGNEELPCSVRYVTRDGQAKAKDDYVHKDGKLEFGPGEKSKEIQIQIVDDVAYEDDEEFYVDLYDVAYEEVQDSGGFAAGPVPDHLQCQVELGGNKTATVVIIDDDLPGVISFQQDTLHVKEEIGDQDVEIVVHRKDGCSGKVTCNYKTENGGAIAAKDFVELDGTLVFNDSERTAKIKVTIKAAGRYERSEDFRLILSNPTGGAKLDPEGDGGVERNILTISIESEQAAKDRVDRIMSALAVNWDKAKVGHANWAEQFRSAIYVNGGDDDGEDEDVGGKSPSIMDWVLHAVTLPWKLFFAFVPPTDYCGGWMCFCCSLGMIGIVTAIINDMASLFGCVLNLGNEVTAITFVALGTSLPDTFASMTAAKQDGWADASIGNVTGSNSVNVFLGLGLPWMIGAIYWRSGPPSDKWNSMYADDPEIPAVYRNGAFVVKAGTLAFSVGVFCGCATVCLIIIYIRRLTCKGELGGPVRAKYATSAGLVGLWCTYVALSSWKSLSAQ